MKAKSGVACNFQKIAEEGSALGQELSRTERGALRTRGIKGEIKRKTTAGERNCVQQRSHLSSEGKEVFDDCRKGKEQGMANPGAYSVALGLVMSKTRMGLWID